MSSLHAPLQQSNMKRELVAIWGYAQRNYFLTRRYFLWEVVWLVYSTMNALTIGFIGVSVGSTAAETARATTFLLIGTLIWSYLSMIFDILSETVSWERWEGHDRIHLHESGQPSVATDRHGDLCGRVWHFAHDHHAGRDFALLRAFDG